MPPVGVRYFREHSGEMPVRLWLEDLRRRSPRGFAKCMARIRRLAALGYELRRPEADLLRDGIYELRIRDGSVNIRLLYFFHRQELTILAHAITKQDRVPCLSSGMRNILGNHCFAQTVGAHQDEVAGFGDEVQCESPFDRGAIDFLGPVPIEVGHGFEALDP